MSSTQVESARREPRVTALQKARSSGVCPITAGARRFVSHWLGGLARRRATTVQQPSFEITIENAAAARGELNCCRTLASEINLSSVRRTIAARAAASVDWARLREAVDF